MPVEYLSHIGVCVSRLDRSLAFYRDALGFREVHRLVVRDEAAARLLELDDVELEAVYLERDGTRVELLHYRRPGHVGQTDDAGDAAARPMNRPGLSHLSLRVRGLDAVLADVEAAGGTVLRATRTGNPAYRAGAVFVLDPDGTRIELVEMPGDPTSLPGQA